MNLADVRETDRHTYKVMNTARGWIVLALDKKTEKLAWTSEIASPPDLDTIAGQRYLLHAGDGIVTIAVFAEDKTVKLQELDAATGKVTGQCQLIGQPAVTFRAVEFIDEDDVGVLPYPLRKAEGEIIERGDPAEGILEHGQFGWRLEVQAVDPASDVQPDIVSDEDDVLLFTVEPSEKPVSRDYVIVLDDAVSVPGAMNEQKAELILQGNRLHVRLRSADPRNTDRLRLFVRMTADKMPTTAQLSTIWQLVHGDTPVERINTSRQDGKLRIVMEAPAPTKQRIVIETDAAK